MNNKERVAFEIFNIREKWGLESNPDRDWHMAEIYMRKSKPELQSIGEEETMFEGWVKAYFNENGWY